MAVFCRRVLRSRLLNLTETFTSRNVRRFARSMYTLTRTDLLGMEKLEKEKQVVPSEDPEDGQILSVHTMEVKKQKRGLRSYDIDEEKFLSKNLYWKRKDILKGLQNFSAATGRVRHERSKRIDEASRDPEDALAKRFKVKLRWEDRKDIIVPRIKGVHNMSPRVLILKMNFFRTQGLSLEEVCKLLSEWPKLLNDDINIIQEKLNYLFEVGYTKKMIQVLLKKAPRVLTLPLKSHFEQKIKDLMELSVSPAISRGDAIDIVQRCPGILMNQDAEKLHSKVKYMRQSLRFTSQQIRNLLMRQPSILTVRMDTMKEKVDFCLNVLGASRSSIARCPRLFQSSLQRLQERHAFLYARNLLDKELRIDDYGLGVIATAPDNVFAKDVGKVSPETYQEFLKKYHENLAEQMQSLQVQDREKGRRKEKSSMELNSDEEEEKK